MGEYKGDESISEPHTGEYNSLTCHAMDSKAFRGEDARVLDCIVSFL
jgi:hypothetical protein